MPNDSSVDMAWPAPPPQHSASRPHAASGRNQTGNPKSQYRKPKQIRNPKIKNRNLRCRHYHSHDAPASTHHAACHSVLLPSSPPPFLPFSLSPLFSVIRIRLVYRASNFGLFSQHARMLSTNTRKAQRPLAPLFHFDHGGRLHGHGSQQTGGEQRCIGADRFQGEVSATLVERQLLIPHKTVIPGVHDVDLQQILAG